MRADSGVLSHAKNSKGVQFSTVFRSKRKAAGRRHSWCVCVSKRKSRIVTWLEEKTPRGGEEWLLKGSREKKKKGEIDIAKNPAHVSFPICRVGVCAYTYIYINYTTTFDKSVFSSIFFKHTHTHTHTHLHAHPRTYTYMFIIHTRFTFVFLYAHTILYYAPAVFDRVRQNSSSDSDLLNNCSVIHTIYLLMTKPYHSYDFCRYLIYIHD